MIFIITQKQIVFRPIVMRKHRMFITFFLSLKYNNIKPKLTIANYGWIVRFLFVEIAKIR